MGGKVKLRLKEVKLQKICLFYILKGHFRSCWFVIAHSSICVIPIKWDHSPIEGTSYFTKNWLKGSYFFCFQIILAVFSKAGYLSYFLRLGYEYMVTISWRGPAKAVLPFHLTSINSWHVNALEKFICKKWDGFLGETSLRPFWVAMRPHTSGLLVSFSRFCVRW